MCKFYWNIRAIFIANGSALYQTDDINQWQGGFKLSRRELVTNDMFLAVCYCPNQFQLPLADQIALIIFCLHGQTWSVRPEKERGCLMRWSLVSGGLPLCFVVSWTLLQKVSLLKCQGFLSCCCCKNQSQKKNFTFRKWWFQQQSVLWC